MDNTKKSRKFPIKKAGGAVSFAVLAVSFWLALYLGNYLTVYLQSLGFSSTVIGCVSSAAAAAGMAGNFLAGRISDRFRTVKWVAVPAIGLTGAFFILFPAALNVSVLGISLALLWWPLACIFRAPACTLVENWIVRGSHSEKFSYGVVRSGGSVGSCLSSVISSLMLTMLYASMSQTDAVSVTYIVSGGLMLVCAAYALTVRDAAVTEKKKACGEELKLRRLFSSYYFVALLLFGFALNIFINPPFVFLPYILTESGIDTAMVGIIVGWEALLEVPILFILVRLRRRFPLYVLVIISGLLFALTALGQGASYSLAALLACGVGFGFANGLNFSCGFQFVYYLAPKELKATAHTFYTIATSLGIIVGNLFAGLLVERMGTRPFYFLFGILTLAVTLLYALSFWYGRRILHLNP